VFNSLTSLDAISGATVLDLFCGSGALGIEALSRGASSATFVDRHRASIQATRTNLLACGLDDRADVVRSDALAHLRDAPAGVDVALLDPPYAFDAWPDVLEVLQARLVVVESDRSIDLGTRWDVQRQRRHGDTVFTIATIRELSKESTP
jgi:16S rRNA (guanine966-N2)-methyltransferase